MKRWLVYSITLMLVCLGGAFVLMRKNTSTYEGELLKVEMLEGSAQTRAAYEQFPILAPKVYGLFGQTPEFGEVVRKYGHNQIVPIVAKCLDGGDLFLEAKDKAAQAFGSLLSLRMSEPKKLEPIDCAWQSILLTKEVGNDFLGQFVIDITGDARRLPGSSLFAFTKRLAVGGLQTLERRLVLGERPTAGEALNAGLDVVGIVLAAKTVSAIAKARYAAEAAKGAATASRATVARQTMLGFARVAAPHVAKYATIGGIAYLAWYHPGVISGAVRSVAEALGLSPLLLQALVWGLLIFVPLWSLSLPLFVFFSFCKVGWRASKGVGRGIGQFSGTVYNPPPRHYG